MSLQDNILDTSRLQLEGDFDSQLSYLLENIRLTKQDVIQLSQLFKDLERALSDDWPGCVVHAFGSIVTGLGIRTSDVDCYVALPNWENSPANRTVMKAKHILSRYRDIFTELFAIPMAKVPIVKFYHTPTQRYCDVNFKSPAGVENSNLIACLLHMDERALPFAVLIKYWAKIHELTGTNLVPNYTMIMLGIFYLQQVRILPSVYSLQLSSECRWVGNWNVAFSDINHGTTNCDSIYELVGGFFEFYSSFDFQGLIISPFLGQSVRKELFKDLYDVPELFHIYKANVRRKVCPLLKTDTLLCVQDPFDHSRNCSAAVYPKLIQKMQSLFRSATNNFKEDTNENFLRLILTPMKDKGVNGLSKKKKRSKVAKQKHTYQPLNRKTALALFTQYTQLHGRKQ